MHRKSKQQKIYQIMTDLMKVYSFVIERNHSLQNREGFPCDDLTSIMGMKSS